MVKNREGLVVEPTGQPPALPQGEMGYRRIEFVWQYPALVAAPVPRVSEKSLRVARVVFDVPGKARESHYLGV
jgi:hypothetical protein